MKPVSVVRALAVAVGVLSLTANSFNASSASPPVLVAAGDIACAPGGAVTATTCQQAATATEIGRIAPTALLVLGDEQYNAGSLSDFQSSYNATWGRFNNIARPVPGNHEYGTPGASGYFSYFGVRSTPRQPTCTQSCQGYYTFVIGAWRIFALNPNCSETSGTCQIGQAQLNWLQSKLATNTSRCILAYAHQPRFSGGFGTTVGMAPLWDRLYAAHADIILAGHAHNYQRFQAMNPTGATDPAGITQYIVGTGGVNVQPASAAPNQQFAASSFGVLQLNLGATGWTASFLDTSNHVLDTSSGTCH